MTWIIKTRDGRYRLNNTWTWSQNLATRYPAKQSAKDAMWSSSIDCRVVRIRTNKQRKEESRDAVILILDHQVREHVHQRWAPICIPKTRGQVPHTTDRRRRRGSSLSPMDRCSRRPAAHTRGAPGRYPGSHDRSPAQGATASRGSSVRPLRPDGRREQQDGQPHRQAGAGLQHAWPRQRRESLTWRR